MGYDIFKKRAFDIAMLCFAWLIFCMIWHVFCMIFHDLCMIWHVFCMICSEQLCFWRQTHHPTDTADVLGGGNSRNFFFVSARKDSEVHVAVLGPHSNDVQVSGGYSFQDYTETFLKYVVFFCTHMTKTFFIILF